MARSLQLPFLAAKWFSCIRPHRSQGPNTHLFKLKKYAFQAQKYLMKTVKQ